MIDKMSTGQCQLLGPFSLIVQGTMGGLALLVLVYKRMIEYPQRPLLVWFFDVSKQVIGALGIHAVNLFLSIISSNSNNNNDNNNNNNNNNENNTTDDDRINPCNWYFLNILFDTTIGVPILWGFLIIYTSIARKFKIKGIESGEYTEITENTNNNDKPKWSFFFKQAIIYFLGLTSMKFVIFVILQVCTFLDGIASFLLSWTYFSPRIQVGFVMMAFPLIMNVFQYYVVDTIIQAPIPHEHHHREFFQHIIHHDDPEEQDRSLSTIIEDQDSRDSRS